MFIILTHHTVIAAEIANFKTTIFNITMPITLNNLLDDHEDRPKPRTQEE